MNKKDSCPLDGSWAQEHCSTHSKNIKNGSISACTHKSECTKLRKALESDLDSSIPKQSRYSSILIGCIAKPWHGFSLESSHVAGCIVTGCDFRCSPWFSGRPFCQTNLSIGAHDKMDQISKPLYGQLPVDHCIMDICAGTFLCGLLSAVGNTFF